MKYLLLILLSIVLVCTSCQSDSGLEFQNEIFISQPIINRTQDNQFKHDQYCTGFISDQFNPGELLKENIKIDQLNALTGLKWKTVETPDSVLNFLNEYTSADDTNRAAYVFEIIRSNSSSKKVISVGSDDGIKIWFNGELVLMDHRGRQMQAHDDLIPVKFKKGFNFILYKIDQGGGNWSLYRKYINISDKNNILAKNVTEHYGGLPVSSIFSDTMTRVQLDIKHNSTIDSLHSVRINWLDMVDKNLMVPAENYLACDLPSELSIPQVLKNWCILKIQVFDNRSDSIVFKEEIPIAYKSFTDSLATALTSNEYNVRDRTLFEARKDAVIQLFNLYDAGNEWEYSTRMQLYALLDLFLSVNVSQEKDLTYSGPRNWAYISEIDSSIQPYRIIMPANLQDNNTVQKPYNLVYSPRWRMMRDIGFWEVYQARSHSVNIRRVNVSTISHSILIVPYSHMILENKGSIIQELNQITIQLKSMLNINPDNISMYMYSSSGGEVLPQLVNEPIPLANIGLINCILPSDKNVIENIFNRLNVIYPDMNWLIWHGVQDEEAPVEMARFLVKHLNSITDKVSYSEEYYSTHIQYFGDPEKDFLLDIANLK